MKEISQRSLTAVVFTIIVLGFILLGKFTFILLFFFIMCGCLWEFYGFFKNSETPAMMRRGFFLAILLFFMTVLYSFNQIRPAFFSILGPLFFALPMSSLFIHKKENLLASALTLWGIFYCVFPICLFIWIGFMKPLGYNYQLILGPLFFVWFNDTGAYVFGKLFGKRKMLEKISPGKTWEGFIGGCISTLVLGFFMNRVFHELNQIQWMVLSLIVVLSGTIGDLVESLYKRELKIKDSGKFFPGHGGMLDRFDSFLMAAPFVYVFLVLIKS